MFDYSNNKKTYTNRKLNLHTLSLDKKRLLAIIVLVFITISIPLTLILLQQSQEIRKYASTPKEREYNGYIVKFKEKSSAEVIGLNSNLNIASIENEKIRKDNNLQLAKRDILKRLNKKAISDKNNKDEVKIKGHFSKAINGVALDITNDEAKELKQSPYVEEVYPDLIVKTNLRDSVPLIGANKIWVQKDTSGRTITGKGVRIGVIDTGINYAHNDLGKTQIEERKFVQVIPTASLIPNVDWEQAFAMDHGRIAYPTENGIVIYDLNTKNVKTVPFLVPIKEVWRMEMVGDIVSYFAWVNGVYEQGTLYYFNLLTGEHKKIVDFKASFGRIAIGGKNIAFSGQKDFVEGVGDAIYVYNIDQGAYKEISYGKTIYTGMKPYISGDTLAVSVPVPLKQCYSKLYLYKLSTGESKEVSPNFLGTISDFKGNKIIYYGCGDGGGNYYVYDISNNQSQKLSYYPSGSFNGAIGFFEFTGRAAITDNVIFLSEYGLGKIFAFDRLKNKYLQINLLKNSLYFEAEGNKVCFASSDKNIYCHDYDSSYSYPLPTNAFNAKVIGGYDYANNDSDPMDDFGHGSHVAGIIAANGLIKGVAPDASLVAYKVLNNRGSGNWSDILKAIDDAVSTRLDLDPNNDIHILNLSIGGSCGGFYDNLCGPDDIVAQAIDNASKHGIISVIAAGNEGPGASTISSPGVARSAITVGSVNKSKLISNFSSRGPVVEGSEMLIKPDVVSPGENICSTGSFGRLGSVCDSGDYISLSGTSMATPHVAGIIALMIQKNPTWTSEQIKQALKNNTDNLGYENNTQGAGLVNAVKILSSIISPITTTNPIPSSTPIIKKITLTSIADSFVRSDQPGTNFGSGMRLKSDGNPKVISYLKFNVASILGKKIISAKLKLTVSTDSGSGSTDTFNLRQITPSSWSEGAVTYDNRPTLGNILTKFNGKSLDQTIEVNVLNYLGKTSVVSWAIATEGLDELIFNSKDSGTASHKPQLIIEYQ